MTIHYLVISKGKKVKTLTYYLKRKIKVKTLTWAFPQPASMLSKHHNCVFVYINLPVGRG